MDENDEAFSPDLRLESPDEKKEGFFFFELSELFSRRDFA